MIMIQMTSDMPETFEWVGDVATAIHQLVTKCPRIFFIRKKFIRK